MCLLKSILKKKKATITANRKHFERNYENLENLEPKVSMRMK
jgi:hypothetical protein